VGDCIASHPSAPETLGSLGAAQLQVHIGPLYHFFVARIRMDGNT
jgi:hypothetical protein